MPAMKELVDAPRAIHLTEKEKQQRRYSPANLQSALEGLHQDGLLVLKSVVSTEHIDHLREVMTSETKSILESKERGGMFNQGVNSNILQCPPLSREDCQYEDIYFNTFILQIANAYLGSKPIWNFTTGNNALAGTKGMRQPVHKDIIFNHPLCPFYFIANFPLSDFSPANGSTEFWLGSHAHTTSTDQIPCTETSRREGQRVGEPSCDVKPEVVEQRRGIRPPVQVVCEKGDVVIRDLRTWHAGMPNESQEDRIMVAIGYQAPWYQNNGQRLYLAKKDAKFFLGGSGRNVEVRANLLDGGELDGLWKNYDFSFAPDR